MGSPLSAFFQAISAEASLIICLVTDRCSMDQHRTQQWHFIALLSYNS